MLDILITLLDGNAIDATPHFLLGDHATLVRPDYLFVKLSLRTNTQSMLLTKNLAAWSISISTSMIVRALSQPAA
jgi:hypothetical protein